MHHPANLAGASVGSPVDLAVHDEAAADIGADEHTHKVVDPCTGAVAGLAERRQIDIVLDQHRQPVALLQQGAQRKRRPVDGAGVLDNAVLVVYDAGRADAQHGTARRGDMMQRCVQSLLQAGQGGRTVRHGAVQRQFGAPDDLAPGRCDRAGDM